MWWGRHNFESGAEPPHFLKVYTFLYAVHNKMKPQNYSQNASEALLSQEFQIFLGPTPCTLDLFVLSKLEGLDINVQLACKPGTLDVHC